MHQFVSDMMSRPTSAFCSALLFASAELSVIELWSFNLHSSWHNQSTGKAHSTDTVGRQASPWFAQLKGHRNSWAFTDAAEANFKGKWIITILVEGGSSEGSACQLGCALLEALSFIELGLFAFIYSLALTRLLLALLIRQPIGRAVMRFTDNFQLSRHESAPAHQAIMSY